MSKTYIRQRYVIPSLHFRKNQNKFLDKHDINNQIIMLLEKFKLKFECQI